MKSQFATFYSAKDNVHKKAARVLANQSQEISHRRLTPVISSGNLKPKISNFDASQFPSRKPSMPSFAVSNLKTESSDGQKKIFKHTRLPKKNVVLAHQSMGTDVSKINEYLNYLDTNYQDPGFEAKMQSKSLALTKVQDLEEARQKSRLEYDQHMPSPLKEIIQDGITGKGTTLEMVKTETSLMPNKNLQSKLTLLKNISHQRQSSNIKSLNTETSPGTSVKKIKSFFDFAVEGNKLFENADPEQAQLAQDLGQNYNLFMKNAAKSKDALNEMTKFFNSYQVAAEFASKEGTLPERVMKEMKESQEAHNNLMSLLKKNTDGRFKNNCMRFFQFKRVNEHLIETNLKFRVNKLKYIEENALSGYDSMKMREKVTIGKLRKQNHGKLNEIRDQCKKNNNVMWFYDDGINVGEMMRKLEYQFGDMEYVQRDTRVINKSLNDIIHNLNHKFLA